MAWKPGPNAPLGVANGVPVTPDLTALVPVGTIREFYEDTQGPGELIYLPGVAATVAGDLVEYDLTPGAQATVRHSNATASNSGRPVAVALAAVTAGLYGWYQISGVAIINATAASAAGAMFATATAGSVNSAADAGDQILNARLSTAVGTPAAGKAYATITRPFVQGQIT
jgi:hypothetical protein